MTAGGFLAIPCTNSLGGGTGGHRHEGGEGRKLCWKFATSWSGADGGGVGFIENTARRYKRSEGRWSDRNCGTAMCEGEGLVSLKVPRGDMNGVGEDEVTESGKMK